MRLSQDMKLFIAAVSVVAIWVMWAHTHSPRRHHTPEEIAIQTLDSMGTFELVNDTAFYIGGTELTEVELKQLLILSANNTIVTCVNY